MVDGVHVALNLKSHKGKSKFYQHGSKSGKFGEVNGLRSLRIFEKFLLTKSKVFEQIHFGTIKSAPPLLNWKTRHFIHNLFLSKKTSLIEFLVNTISSFRLLKSINGDESVRVDD